MKKFKFVNDIRRKFEGTIKSFKDNPIENLGVLLPTLSVLTAIIGFIVAYILFIVQGGYATQVNVIKADGMRVISNAFTSGTTSIIYGNIVGTIIKLLFILEFVLMLGFFFIKVHIVKRVIMIVDLALTSLLSVAVVIFNGIYTGQIKLTEGQEIKFTNVFNKLHSQSDKTFFIVLTVICVLIIVSFLVLVLTSESKWMLGYNCLAGIISFAIIPLILLLLENIIPLLAEIVVLAILGMIFWFILAGIGSPATSNSGSSRGSTSSGSRSGILGSTSLKMEKKEEKPKEKDVKVKNFSGNVRFYRGEGGCGFIVPQVDSIYFDGNLQEHKFVCTVKEYEKGEVIIMLNNKRVTNL